MKQTMVLIHILILIYDMVLSYIPWVFLQCGSIYFVQKVRNIFFRIQRHLFFKSSHIDVMMAVVQMFCYCAPSICLWIFCTYKYLHFIIHFFIYTLLCVVLSSLHLYAHLSLDLFNMVTILSFFSLRLKTSLLISNLIIPVLGSYNVLTFSTFLKHICLNVM